MAISDSGSPRRPAASSREAEGASGAGGAGGDRRAGDESVHESPGDRAQPGGRTGGCPPQVAEFADRAVAYVQAAVGPELDYGGDTLPLLDHYLRGVPGDQGATLALVAATAGAYFGEVVRRGIGGRWVLGGAPHAWRVVLPSAISFAPAGVVASVIAQRDDFADLDPGLDVPPALLPYLEAALDRMGEITHDEYYSLSGRYDTLEHLHAVIVAVAARASAEREAGS